MTDIEKLAFSRCTGLTSIYIPNSVTKVGKSAFKDCIGLTYADFASIKSLCSINFMDSYSNPLFYAHKLHINGKEVTSINIPVGTTIIGTYTFYGCSGLTSINIPDGVTGISAYAFYGCSGLTSINIPDGITGISDRAFYGCSGLTSINIPDGVTVIGNSAFYGCSGLKSITIPKEMTLIGKFAFSGCIALNEVYYNAEKILADGDANVFDSITYEKASLYLTEDGIMLYRFKDPWKNFKNVKNYDPAGIDELVDDFDNNEPYEIYSINGSKVNDNLDGLTPGIYIIRQYNMYKKIIIR